MRGWRVGRLLGLLIGVLALIGCSGGPKASTPAKTAATFTAGPAAAIQSPLTATPRAATAVETPTSTAGSVAALTASPGAAFRPAPATATGTPQSAAQGEALQDWPVFDRDPQRSGANPDETAITAATAGGLHRLWSQSLPEHTGGSPILLSGLSLANGSTADLLFLTTSHGSTLALNAQNGAIVWRKDTSGPQIGNQSCQICATPAADPSRQWVYAAGNDGAVHKYAAVTGQEETTPPWPVPVTLLNGFEKRSSALNVANGYLYVAMSGYFGDFGPYVGHILAISLADGSSRVFNALCSDQHQLLAPRNVVASSAASCSSREAGIWGRGGVVVDQSGGPTDGNLFVTTGNGPFRAADGSADYGDSVLRLKGDASALLDSYTPNNYSDLDARDIDLGSAAPVLLPPQQGSSAPYLMVQGGKDSLLRLISRTHLGGVGGQLQQVDTKAGGVYNAPAVWQEPGGPTWLFVATSGGVIIAYTPVTDAGGQTTLQEKWRLNQSGSSPIVAGGVLFVAGGDNLVARDPHTGKELWNSGQASAGGNIGKIHWQGPIVVNGRLYIADDDGHVTAYGLGGQ